MNLGEIKGMEIIAPDEAIPPKKLLITLYGDPGIGKTSVAFTAGKPFLLDFDKGVERAVQEYRPFVLRINDYQAMKNILESDQLPAQVEQHGYQCVILDTGGTMLDNCIAPWLIKQNSKLGNNTGGLSLQGWGALSVEFNQLVVNKLREMGLHVIVICHAKEDGDGDNRKIRPLLKGSSLDILYQSCDLLGFMTMRGTKRTIDFNPTQEHHGKNVANLPVQVVPDAQDPAFAGFLKRLIDQTLEGMQKQTSKQKEALQRMEEIKEKMAKCETPDDIDIVVGLAADLGTVYKVQTKKLADERFAQVYAQEHFAKLKTGPKLTEAAKSINQDLPIKDHGRQRVYEVKLALMKHAESLNFVFDETAKAFKKKPKAKADPTENGQAVPEDGKVTAETEA